jgi:hypothetical protein
VLLGPPVRWATRSSGQVRAARRAKNIGHVTYGRGRPRPGMTLPRGGPENIRQNGATFARAPPPGTGRRRPSAAAGGGGGAGKSPPPSLAQEPPEGDYRPRRRPGWRARPSAGLGPVEAGLGAAGHSPQASAPGAAAAAGTDVHGGGQGGGGADLLAAFPDGRPPPGPAPAAVAQPAPGPIRGRGSDGSERTRGEGRGIVRAGLTLRGVSAATPARANDPGRVLQRPDRESVTPKRSGLYSTDPRAVQPPGGDYRAGRSPSPSPPGPCPGRAARVRSRRAGRSAMTTRWSSSTSCRSPLRPSRRHCGQPHNGYLTGPGGARHAGTGSVRLRTRSPALQPSLLLVLLLNRSGTTREKRTGTGETRP